MRTHISKSILFLYLIILYSCSNKYNYEVTENSFFSNATVVESLGVIDTILVHNPKKNVISDELGLIIKWKIINKTDSIISISLSNDSYLSSCVYAEFEYYKKKYKCEFVYGIPNEDIVIKQADSVSIELCSLFYFEGIFGEMKQNFEEEIKCILPSLKFNYAPYFLYDTIVRKDYYVSCNEKTRVFMSNDYAGFFGYKIE